MLLSICGTRSAISLATLRLVQIIAQTTIGEPTIISASSLDQLRAAWKDIPQDKRGVILVYSDGMEADLAELLTDSNFPVVTTADDFESIVAFQVNNLNAELSAAIQVATHTAVQMTNIGSYGKKLAVRSDVYDQDIMDYAKDLIGILGFPSDEERSSKLTTLLRGEGGAINTFADFISATFPEWKPQSAFWSSLSDEERETIQELAPGYDALMKGNAVEAIYWPSRCFFDGDSDGSGKPLMGAKPLSGPARHIFYGPHFCLPRGRWNAEVYIELNDGKADAIGHLDVFSGTVLSGVTMRFPRRGAYAIDISFNITHSHKPVEIRLLLMKSAVEGELRLTGVKLSPAQQQPVKSSQKLLEQRR